MVCCVVFFPWSHVFLNICFCHKRGSITLIIIDSSILTYNRINFGTIWARGTIWDQIKCKPDSGRTNAGDVTKVTFTIN